MGAQARIRYPTKAAIDKAVAAMIAAAEKAGIDVGAVEVSPDGRIRIVDARAVMPSPANEFDRWESQL
ncbi:hypothetical protein [Sphingobium sp. YC-XJ3]|uniref:hypothetical protein n=1 Tax=Sphingobium sp. YC-XJ3 TaxID=3024245 RepID=UPI00235F6FBB|nr:hypothetical protein [Sphingobium sp. YC-XJ3]WDA36452.1 hypothetical protein PO876_23985 [Sphingobium sp. YC-XJ3]